MDRYSLLATAIGSGRARALGLVLLLLTPSVTSAQVLSGQGISSLDLLFPGSNSDDFARHLSDRFVQDLLLLVPNLPAGERELLISSVSVAFDPETLRAEVDAAIATDLPSDVFERIMKARQVGPQAVFEGALQGSATVVPPEGFSGALDEGQRARVQLMARLVESQGRGDLDLVLNEAVRRVAHGLVDALGRGVGPFEPISDEQFDLAYRQQTLSLAIESAYRFQSVPDEVIVAVITDYETQEWRSFIDTRSVALVKAIGTAGQRVFDLMVVGEEKEGEPEEPTSDARCRTSACALVDVAAGHGNGIHYGLVFASAFSVGGPVSNVESTSLSSWELDVVFPLSSGTWWSLEYPVGLILRASLHDTALGPALGDGQRWLVRREDGRTTSRGLGLRPAGIRFSVGPRTVRLQTEASVGALYFDIPSPAENATRFNFTAEIGIGLRVEVPGAHLNAGYRLHHLSNGGLGAVNPGVDSQMIYFGFWLY